MSIKKVSSSKSHLMLFMEDEELFVWSKSRCELYGFEGVGIAIFFYMEECPKRRDVFRYFSAQGLQKTKEFIELVKQIRGLLEDSAPSCLTTQKVPSNRTKRLMKEVSFKHSFVYRLNKDSFLLDIEDEELMELVLPTLERLRVDDEDDKYDFRVSILRNEKDLFAIYINDELRSEVSNKLHIVPSLYDQIRIHHYQQHPFLVALHAASLSYKDSVVIFPAISNSGKSTIGAYLMQHKFTLFSDELSVIGEDFSLTPLPLGVTLKEGSWHLFEESIEDIKNLHKHLRFDLQKIKFIAPPTIMRENYIAKKYIFIFPHYKKGSVTTLTHLSLKRALELFIETGYHISNPKDGEMVYKWLNFLTQATLLELTYSNIDEAYENIKKAISL